MVSNQVEYFQDQERRSSREVFVKTPAQLRKWLDSGRRDKHMEHLLAYNEGEIVRRARQEVNLASLPD
eukprot:2211803-Karenia_brevis.AAC.1